MRLTSKLCAQHIGFMFKKHWHLQGKRIIRTTGAVEELQKNGIVVKDALDIVYQKLPPIELEIFKKTPIDTSAYVKCFEFGNNNVFVEGLQQAQNISNSIVIDEFPEKVANAVKNAQVSSNTNKNIHRAILASCCLDAEQEKLSRIKVPGKPMYKLPRKYGISPNRKCELLISKLLFECDKLSGSSSAIQNKCVNYANFDLFIKKENDLIRLNVKADTLLLSKQPIKAFKSSYEGTIPDLFPMNFSIGLPQLELPKNEYQPFIGKISEYWPHILFSHFIPEDVTNLYGSPVNVNQFKGRTLLKSFVAAYSKAKTLYGNNIKDLNKPIIVQSVHTDGKQFHFGIFQLNTMDLNESNKTKNIWFQIPILNLFDVCEYQKGKPILDDYNPDIFKILNVFYQNS